MNKWIKRTVVLSLSLSMMCGLGAAASAASKTEEGYTLTVEDDQLEMVSPAGGVSTYDLRSADIELKKEDGNLVVVFTDDDGKLRWITLGEQESIQVGGELKSLKLDEYLGRNLKVDIGRSARISQIIIEGVTPVNIAGDVDRLEINNKCKVIIEDKGSVLTAFVRNSNATLVVERGADVEHVIAAEFAGLEGSESYDLSIVREPLVRGSSRWRYYDDDDDDYEVDDGRIKDSYYYQYYYNN